ncbi:NAD(P)-binding protein [Pseudalkalibacillus decolorationis]|uniref:NAD(P)-binding protein n=1 Tax=Pseudalkalibacillus decolorationis TaxID=163879 RepID=UPI0021491949|nr:NAD(P)-binding protein [Pseudalkalibacillus decolorationis]
MSHYPIMINLQGKKAVVIGGGKVAYRKILSLLEAKAEVTVVSPAVIVEVKTLIDKNGVSWYKKQVEATDYQDAFIVIAATNRKETNQEVAEQAGSHQLVNIVDQPNLGNFHVPAKLTRGKLTIAVSTGGASPILAKKIRDDLSKTYDETYEDYLEDLFKYREKIKQMPLSEQEKRTRLVEYEEADRKRR